MKSIREIAIDERECKTPDVDCVALLCMAVYEVLQLVEDENAA